MRTTKAFVAVVFAVLALAPMANAGPQGCAGYADCTVC